MAGQTLKKPKVALDFQEVYQNAYSHGLERIYAIEDIDLKSVRVMGGNNSPAVEDDVFEYHLPLFAEDFDPQLEFDLGEAYRGWMPSFVLHEPIQVLGLSKHAEKCLLDNQKTILQDVIHADLNQFVFMKGMGQGHIEEVKIRLKNYLEGKVVNKCKGVDFAAWIKTLFGSFDRRKVYVFLETFSLSELFSLTPVETVQVKQLTSQKKNEWIQEVAMLLTQENDQNRIAEQMQMVTNVFIKPWMRQRYGFATKEELFERIHRISLKSELTASALALFSELFFQFQMPLASYLIQINDELFCSDYETEEQYHTVVSKAMTYFYKTNLFYDLTDLTSWLEREFARNWHSFPHGFIEHVLRISPEFRVRKGEHGCLLVRLA